MIEKRMNKKVVFLSLVALILFALTYLVHWLFILPIAVILWINNKELFGAR